MFNNQLKDCFSFKEIYITIQTHPTQIVKSIFLMKKQFFIGFLKIIGVQI